MNAIHTQIETWMVAALTDALSAAERNAFDAHLQTCARCRQLFADQQTVSSLLEQTFAADQPDDEFEERIIAQFRQNVAKKKRFTLPDLRKAREAWLAFCQFPVVRVAAATVIVALLIVLGGALSGEVNLISLKSPNKEPSSGYPQVYLAPETQGTAEFYGTYFDSNKASPDDSKGIWVWNNFENSALARKSPLLAVLGNATEQDVFARPRLDMNSVALSGSGTTSTAFPAFANRMTVANGARWAVNSGTTNGVTSESDFEIGTLIVRNNTYIPLVGGSITAGGGGVNSPVFANRVLRDSGTLELLKENNSSAPNIFEVAGLDAAKRPVTMEVGGVMGAVTNNGLLMGDSVGLLGSLSGFVANESTGLIVGSRSTPDLSQSRFNQNPKLGGVYRAGAFVNDGGATLLASQGKLQVVNGSTLSLPDNFLGGNAVAAQHTSNGTVTSTGMVLNQIAAAQKEGGWRYAPGDFDGKRHGGIGYGDGAEQGRLVNEGGEKQGEIGTLRVGRLDIVGGSISTFNYNNTELAKNQPKGTKFDLWSGAPPRGDSSDDIANAKQQLAEAEKRAQEVRAQTEKQLAGMDAITRFGPRTENYERATAFEIVPPNLSEKSELGFGRGLIDANGLTVDWTNSGVVRVGGGTMFVGGLFTNTGRIVAGDSGSITAITSKEVVNSGGALTIEGFGTMTDMRGKTSVTTGSITLPDQMINQGGGTIIVTGSVTNRTLGGGTFTTGVPEVKPPAQLAQNPPPNQLAQQPPPRQQPRQQPPKAAPPAPQPPPVGVTEVRKLIRSAQMEFEVNSYDETLARVQEIVGEERGLLVTSNSSRLPNGKVRGDVVIKVLPDFLERLVWKLRGIGELKKQTLGSQDVTKQYFDTEARKRNLEAMEKRLLEMLARVQGKVPELLEVEKEIARVRAEIEGLQGELKYVDTLVAYATINLTLYEKDLNQAAAFQLKEKANLSIFSPDVEKTLNDAKRSAETAKAQVLHSKLDRETSGRVTGTFSVLVAPEVADLLLESFRNLGRVGSLNRTSERVAIGGQGASDTAKVEKDKVEINLVIVHDDESRRRVRLTVVTKAVEESLEKAKAAAAKHSAEVLVSNFTRPSAGESAAQFTVRVPAKAYDAVLGEFKAFGRVAEFNVELKENNTDGKENAAPVLIAMVLASSEPPLQITHLAVQRQGVETVLDKLKTDAVKLGGEIRASNFVRSPDGQELANLAFRIPLKDNGALVEMLKTYGDVKSFTVERQDRVQEGKPDENAPAEVRLQFFSHQAPMQITQLGIERKDVESVLAALKEQATKLGAEIRASNFVRYPNGQEVANLAFRIPMKQNQQLLDLLRSLGEIKGYTVERQDRVTDGRFDESAPAEVRLQLGSAPPIIEKESGFMATMKQTVGQGFGWFMWGIKMIGVALAFIAPWLAALLIAWWSFKKLRRKKPAKA